MGKSIRGHVLDVRPQPLEDALKRYDPKLYLRWNPAKRDGYGMWELRRLPEQKVPIYVGEHAGITYYKMTYVEQNLVNHIMDIPYLGYHVLEWVKNSDTWGKEGYGLDKWEYDLKNVQDKAKAKARAEMVYELRHDKAALSTFKDAVMSGYRPDDFFKGIYDKDYENSVYNDKRFK